MFDLDYKHSQYQRGDGEGMKASIADILAGGKFVRLQGSSRLQGEISGDQQKLCSKAR